MYTTNSLPGKCNKKKSERQTDSGWHRNKPKPKISARAICENKLNIFSLEYWIKQITWSLCGVIGVYWVSWDPDVIVAQPETPRLIL